jgi:hypothetical protein
METVRVWLWFAVWLVVGAGFSFGLIALPFFLPPAVLVTIVLARRHYAGLSSPGLIAGLGAAPLLIAYNHRSETGGSSPLGWLAAGLIFLAVGIAWFVVARRSDLRALSSAPQSQPR